MKYATKFIGSLMSDITQILVKKDKKDDEDADQESDNAAIDTSVRSEVQEFFVVVADLYTFFKLHEVKEWVLSIL